MTAVATFDELLARIPPANRGHLDSKIDSDIHLEEIGKVLVCWEGVRPYIGLSVAEEEAIKRDHLGVERERVGMLRKWRERFGPYGTFRNLTKSFYDAGRLDLVEAVCNLMSSLGPQLQSQARPTLLKDVVTVLTDFPGWYTLRLGVGLEVPKTTLDTIHANYCNGVNAVERCKIEIVDWWLNNTENPTWAALVAALKAIGKTGLAKRIAKKYDVALDHPPVSRDVVSTQLKTASCTSEQHSMIVSLQSDIALKDEQLLKVEKQEEKLLLYTQRIDEELAELREQMQFNEKHMGMILSDSRLLRMELIKREEQVRHLQQQNERFELLQQTEMLQAELRKNEQILEAKKAEVDHVKKRWNDSESKLAAANEGTHELNRQVADMQSRFDSITKELEQVCSERESLKETLQEQEKEVDQRMLHCLGVKPPEQEEVEYYNVMVSAGRVEIKLRESEVEMIHHQLEVKRSQVDLLTKQVQCYKEKCLDVEKRSHDEIGSSAYSYAYARNMDPTSSALEKHLTEQMMNQLATENLRYKIRLAAEEAAKQRLERHLESLVHELKDLRRVHSEFESRQQQQAPPIPPRQRGLQIEMSQQQKVHEPPPVPLRPSPLPYVGPPPDSIPQKPTIPPRQQSLQRRLIKSPPPDFEAVKPLPKQTQSADPQKCTAVGSGVEVAETAQVAEFEVHLADANGDPCTAIQDVTAKLKSIASSSVTKATLVSKTPATYEVFYQSRVRGRHDLIVRVNSTPIQGSPFRVYVRQSPRLLGKPVRVIGGLNVPWGMVTSRNGNMIIILLCEENRVSVYTKYGHKIKSIESVQSDIRSYKLDPTGVAVDGSGNMYIADCEVDRLFKLKSDGKLVKSVGGKGEKPGEFDQPKGIAIKEDNKLFVCDKNNCRIQIFDTDLNLISCFGTKGYGEGEFLWPIDLAIDGAGNLYVVDQGNHRIQVFSQSGTFLRTIGEIGLNALSYPLSHGFSALSYLSYPLGIHVDNDLVHVTEGGNHRVSVFTTSGEFITSFGNCGSGEGEFNIPRGITTDEDGYVYVCDSNNHRIQVF